MNRSGHNDLRAVVGAAIFYVGDSPDQSPDNSSLSDTINTGGSGGPGPTEWPPSSSPLVQCNGHGRRGHSAEEEEEEEETIKRRLKFFFMNPREKYEARRVLPWKLLLQAVKVVLVTSQLAIFANLRFAHTNYVTGQTIALQHLFIKVRINTIFKLTGPRDFIKTMFLKIMKSTHVLCP